ncbi:hypothetical protein [Agromyces sp. Leaf222]|uniref:hypothetical protein n=1 Tax=Agromyces sp. Leaf222 TaxID=1735688 RepID=UPI0006FBCA44|nr:hypothetical protein [Agromyces sp. Leaf222]KQM83324.1 hypothetical protein ASE68_08950 [Agromyces sp. Leaf222]
MAKLSSVLGTDDFSIAELCAARIDGDLVAIAGAWAPIDEPDVPAFRALVVAHSAPRALVIERMSAAWVHGARVAPPRTAQFCVPIDARISMIADPALTVREVRIDDSEVVSFDGVRCTSLVRTSFDLLRDTSVTDDETVEVVASLLDEHHALERAVRLKLEATSRLPHKARASARLDRAAVVCGRRPASRASRDGQHGPA